MEIEHNRIKNSNCREATSWLFTSVAEDLNSGQQRTNPASGREPGTGLRVRRNVNICLMTCNEKWRNSPKVTDFFW